MAFPFPAQSHRNTDITGGDSFYYIPPAASSEPLPQWFLLTLPPIPEPVAMPPPAPKPARRLKPPGNPWWRRFEKKKTGRSL